MADVLDKVITLGSVVGGEDGGKISAILCVLL